MTGKIHPVNQNLLNQAEFFYIIAENEPAEKILSQKEGKQKKEDRRKKIMNKIQLFHFRHCNIKLVYKHS